MQEIYMFMDDSGKLTNKENYLVYGGIIFTSQSEKQKFSNQYRAIIKSIRCSYCSERNNFCSKDCVEIKSSKINDNDRRRIINLCKKYKVFSLVVENAKVYSNIMSSKSSKGRYIDYVQKITIKEVLKTLIHDNIIDSSKEIKVCINIDQQTTKSNGYYNLKDSIYEDIKYGIINFNYGVFHAPLFQSDVDVTVNYIDSKKCIAIQAADIIAGTTRRIMYYSELKDKRIQRLQKFNWVIKFFP